MVSIQLFCIFVKVCTNAHRRGSQAALSDIVDTQQCSAQGEGSFQPATNLQVFETWESVTQGKKEVVAVRKRAQSGEQTIKQSIPKCSSIVCGTKFSTCSSWSSVCIQCTCWLPKTCNSQCPDQLNDKLMLSVGYFICWIWIHFFSQKLNLNPLYHLVKITTKLPAIVIARDIHEKPLAP